MGGMGDSDSRAARLDMSLFTCTGVGVGGIFGQRRWGTSYTLRVLTPNQLLKEGEQDLSVIALQ